MINGRRPTNKGSTQKGEFGQKIVFLLNGFVLGGNIFHNGFQRRWDKGTAVRFGIAKEPIGRVGETLAQGDAVVQKGCFYFFHRLSSGSSSAVIEVALGSHDDAEANAERQGRAMEMWNDLFVWCGLMCRKRTPNKRYAASHLGASCP